MEPNVLSLHMYWGHQHLNEVHYHWILKIQNPSNPSTWKQIKMYAESTVLLSGPCELVQTVFSLISFHSSGVWGTDSFVSLLVAFMCPDTLRYQACLPACTSQSCPNHDFDSDPDQCSGLTEGCVCPEGTLLHRPYSALCIPPDKCGKHTFYLSRSWSWWGAWGHLGNLHTLITMTLIFWWMLLIW